MMIFGCSESGAEAMMFFEYSVHDTLDSEVTSPIVYVSVDDFHELTSVG